MEPVARQILPRQLDEDDEREAFRRMLMQSAPSAPRAVPVRPPSKASFDPALQAAYTHGLDLIYALESVDPDSIRRIASLEEKVEAYDILESSSASSCLPEQLEFDFGPGFRTWMEPLILLEPIGVLGLPAQAEKVLLEARRFVISDLLDYDLRLLGLGQGHIDDIRSKLSEYLQGKDLKRCEAWDLEAFLRALLLFCDVRAGYVLFQDYGLEGVCRLTSATAAEVRRAGPEQQRHWREDAVATLRAPESRDFFRQKMQEAISAFAKLWMLRRDGVASRIELLERLQRVSVQTDLVQPFFAWAREVFGDGESVLDDLMVQPIEGFFCIDVATSKQVTMLLQCVRSYFYNANVTYPLSQLCALVERELAYYWIGTNPTQISKILELCPWVKIRKGSDGLRVVRLA